MRGSSSLPQQPAKTSQQPSQRLSLPSDQRIEAAIGGVTAEIAAINNRMISLGYKFIDQRRRRLALLEVSLNGSNWNFCKHEGGAPDFA